MGRTVSIPLHSHYKYDFLPSVTEDEITWDEFTEDVAVVFSRRFKSLEPCDKWIDKEERAILENSFCYVGVSEYCGWVSVWLKSKADEIESMDYYTDMASKLPLAKVWFDNVEAGFMKEVRMIFENYRSEN